ncbi:hypothetical protein Tco_0534676 [Tanacetum coccineum]
MFKDLGYIDGRLLLTHFRIPRESLDEGLLQLMSDEDVSRFLEYVHSFREEEVYIEIDDDANISGKEGDLESWFGDEGVDQDIDVKWQDDPYHLVDEPKELEEISDMFAKLGQAMDELVQVIKAEDETNLFVVYDQAIDHEGDVVLVEVIAEEMVAEEDDLIRMKIDQGVGSTSGIRACALRNFDLGKMELENSQNNALAKLPMLKLGEYEMWEIRIKQYFQIQDYALWEVIENGNSWVPIPVTAPESGPSTALKMTVPSTTKEKICKKNDVKARSLLLMALPNEHQLTFNYTGNTKASSLVSRLAILGVDTPPEDLNVKFLRSLPSEWDTIWVVWMNKPDFETMGLDDLYNNFKIVEQKVKRNVAVNNDDKNLAFLTTSSPSSTNTINTANTGVSTGNTKVNTASTETSTASFSD